MSCHPGTPCYNGGTTVYPKHCGVDPCYVYKTNTDNTFYNSGNLPCTGVNTCDSLTTVLQKIDNKLCPENLALAILNAILNDSGLLNQFCTVVSNCQSTTTSTTTEAPVPNVIRIAPANGEGFFGVIVDRLSGENPDSLTFSVQLNRYLTTNCTGSNQSYSISAATLDPNTPSYFAGTTSENLSYLSAKITSLSVNSIPITTSPQTVTIGSNTYIIEGYNVCTDIS